MGISNMTQAILYMDDSFLLVPNCIAHLTKRLATQSLPVGAVKLDHMLTRIDPADILEWENKVDVASNVIRECGRLHRQPCHVCRKGTSPRFVLSIGGLSNKPIDDLQPQQVWACQVPT